MKIKVSGRVDYELTDTTSAEGGRLPRWAAMIQPENERIGYIQYVEAAREFKFDPSTNYRLSFNGMTLECISEFLNTLNGIVDYLDSSDRRNRRNEVFPVEYNYTIRTENQEGEDVFVEDIKIIFMNGVEPNLGAAGDAAEETIDRFHQFLQQIYETTKVEFCGRRAAQCE